MERKINHILSGFYKRTKLIGLLVFIGVVVLFSFILYQDYNLSLEEEKRREKNTITSIKQNVDYALKNSYVAALTLALTINDEGNPVNFEEVAQKILSSSVAINSVQLVEKGVVLYVPDIG
ncbi:hypothetical protein [Mesonia sp. K7]|uniref:hypothetical protein n=1 Tax=Mesonia sp. K7 TaxID=2218606 RepID=UPI000DAA5D74|nr:hypothetical protein [Mesonia sp. K7]PZD78936.1 hypothetical protein DNG35_02725 [Mesonia sp. K7]